MGALAFIGLALCALAILGFMIYGVYLGMAALARCAEQLWARVMVFDAGDTAIATAGTRDFAQPRQGTATKFCWEIMGCSDSAKRSCPAHARPDLPCWLARMEAHDDHRLNPSCMACQLFNIPALMTGV